MAFSQLRESCKRASVLVVMAGKKGAIIRDDWPAIRAEYEGGTMNQHEHAAKLGISYSTYSQRAAREGWRQKARLLRKAQKVVEAKIESLAIEHAAADLAPWIEQKKAEFTRKGFEFADTGLNRVLGHFKRAKRVLPRDEALVAKAGSEYHRAGRMALGMSDGATIAGPINLNVLVQGGQFPTERVLEDPGAIT